MINDINSLCTLNNSSIEEQQCQLIILKPMQNISKTAFDLPPSLEFTTTMGKDNTVTAAAAVSGGISETRSAITSIISKPKMTDKLLARPPFRFLFDIFIAVNAATDLELEQALTEAELDSANLKDKSSKLSFLDKVIKHVETRLDITIDLNAKKVVAGLETEKTRRFLQLLATAATTNAPTVTSGEDNSGPPPGEVIKDGKVEAPTDSTIPSAADISPREPSPLEDVIAETRSAITSIISKPKLTDKLLARPPFRFLFDVIAAVDAATNLGLEQVLTADEYDSFNVTDKASKLLFLDKIVKHVEGKLDTTIDINPKKVVAGLEPDKTCAFLQLLAAAAMLPPDHKGSGEDMSGSKDEEDGILIGADDANDADDATDKEDEIADTLNLTSESQFLAIAKDGSADDPESFVEAGVHGSSSIIADNGDVEDPAPVEHVTEDIEVEEAKEDVDVEIDDNVQEKSEAAMESVDGPRSDKEPVASFASPVVDKDVAETTGHLLTKAGAAAGASLDDDGIEVLRPNALISSMSGSVDAVESFTEEMVGANSEPTMDLQATIEVVLSVTGPLGQCLGDMDVAAMNEERAYWSNQVEVETRKLEEYRRQQDATVLAPLLQKIQALDAEIVEKEKEVEEALERIGGADESD